jgi:indolepyruvate ferredoxin oxidoreductase, beta subunit
VSEPRILSVLIPAVGGQGGGVLSEWIVEAALHEGYPVQATSIPGVAQRTGSTSYLVELLDRPRAELDGREPVFSLFPVPGALDVLLAPEFLEVGRAIEIGFPSPDRTTIVASTHRLYSIHEKITTSGARFPQETLAAAARAFSRRFVGFDALALAREHRTEANAVLLGALAAAEVLPIPVAAFRAAIEKKGVGVEANLRGFDVGYTRAAGPAETEPPTAPALGVHEGFAADVARHPEPLRPVLSHALARLVDYQDRGYAERYLGRLAPIVAADRPPYTLSALVARALAVWMTYEDAIRVADLKTRAGRFRRIRAGVRDPKAEIVVTDYLKPDLDEIYGILPDRLVRPFATWAERRWPRGRPTIGQHVKTTTVSGYLRLWLLARLRPLRPISYRGRHEHALMERWLGTVTRLAPLDAELGCEVAEVAGLVKGYGEVRRRMTAAVTGVLEAAEAAAAIDPAAARELTAECRRLIQQGPEGEVAARDEARRRLEALRASSRAGVPAAGVR